jgi:hypothetical protein
MTPERRLSIGQSLGRTTARQRGRRANKVERRLRARAWVARSVAWSQIFLTKKRKLGETQKHFLRAAVFNQAA